MRERERTGNVYFLRRDIGVKVQGASVFTALNSPPGAGWKGKKVHIYFSLDLTSLTTSLGQVSSMQSVWMDNIYLYFIGHQFEMLKTTLPWRC